MNQAPTPRLKPLPRAHFPHFQAVTTRWMDNDVYGHLNNVVHYSYFDTAVNRTLERPRCSTRKPTCTDCGKATASK